MNPTREQKPFANIKTKKKRGTKTKENVERNVLKKKSMAIEENLNELSVTGNNLKYIIRPQNQN